MCLGVRAFGSLLPANLRIGIETLSRPMLTVMTSNNGNDDKYNIRI